MEWMLMPLKRYAEFSGRSRRKEYWMFTLFQILVLIVMGVLVGITGGFDESGASTLGSAMLVIMGLIYLGLFLIPGIAVTVRRFHDQDKSGWFYLLSFIPYVGGLIMLVFMCLEGTQGPNQYGPDPKGYGDADVFE